MKTLVLILGGFLLVGCAHTPDSRDFISYCKVACRGQVTHYQDDTVDCVCKAYHGNDVVKP